MYNRYIPYGTEYRRIPEDDGEGRPEKTRPEHASTLSSLLKSFKPEKLDAGDTLLLLIILFLFLDGEDNWELIIALGLLLLLGAD